jgi:hypothetical protein
VSGFGLFAVGPVVVGSVAMPFYKKIKINFSNV